MREQTTEPRQDPQATPRGDERLRDVAEHGVRRAGLATGAAIGIVVAALVAAFIAQNGQALDLEWLWFDFRTGAWLALLVAFAAGLVTGPLLAWGVQHGYRRRRGAGCRATPPRTAVRSRRARPRLAQGPSDDVIDGADAHVAASRSLTSRDAGVPVASPVVEHGMMASSRTLQLPLQHPTTHTPLSRSIATGSPGVPAPSPSAPLPPLPLKAKPTPPPTHSPPPPPIHASTCSRAMASRSVGVPRVVRKRSDCATESSYVSAVFGDLLDKRSDRSKLRPAP